MAQPPDTPGRRSRRIEKQPPFNPHPKDVGTRTGRAMPTNVPRDSMGFENPADFFLSPGGTEAPGTSQTIRTFGGAASVLRSEGRMSIGSVGTVVETPAPRGGRMRMSHLAAASDEEDGTGLGHDLLDDGDEVLDKRLSSPAPWYSTNETPRVPLPAATKLPPHTPADAYDDLPTPQKSTARKSRIGVGREAPSPAKSTYSHVGISPAKSATSSRLAIDELDMDLANIDDDDAFDTGNVTMASVARSPSVRATPARSPPAPSPSRKSADTEIEEEVEHEETPRIRPAAKGKKTASAGDEPGPSSPDMPDHSFTMAQDDDAGGYGGDDTPGDISHAYDDDVSMEEAAVAAENLASNEREEHDEQDDSDDDQIIVRKKKSKPAGSSPARRKAKRGQRADSRPVEKRSRVSGIGGGEGERYKGDFTTRSGRKHLEPLAYWRGEKVNYGRGPGLAVIKEVVRIEPEPKVPLGQRNRTRARSQSVKPKSDGHDEDGWDDETEPVGLVTEFATNREIQRRVAFPAHRLNPKFVSGDMFRYQKVFGEDQFIASGVVYIPVGSSKPAKQSKDNSYVFFVVCGAVQVTVHKTSFVMAPGGMFMVPRGNEYKIENISKKEVQLFFAQARKIRMNEADEQAFENHQEMSAERARSMSESVKPSRERLGTEQSGEEESEESEEEEPPRRQAGRVY